MGFSEPVVNEGGRYTALFHTGPDVPGAAAMVEVILNVGEGDWTGEGLDGLFQGVVDVLTDSTLLTFVGARKAQNTSTTVTPTAWDDESPAAELPGESF